MAAQKNIVDIKTGLMFPFPFLALGVIFIITAAVVFVNHPFIAGALVLAGGFILTAHEGTEIIPASHTYKEYHSFFFLKKGTAKKYDGIEKIFINSSKVSQKVYTAHTSTSATFSGVEYNAYLKFSEGVKVFLLSGKDKLKLRTRLNNIASSLNTSVVDNTGFQ